MDRITARFNSGESLFDGVEGIPLVFVRGQALSSESELESKLVPLGMVGPNLGFELVPQQTWLDNWYFSLPKSPNRLGDGGTPLPSHRSQVSRPFLPYR